MIRLITMKDGLVVINRRAKSSATLEDILEIAENEVNGGYADYSRVEVDGEIYAEYET